MLNQWEMEIIMKGVSGIQQIFSNFNKNFIKIQW